MFGGFGVYKNNNAIGIIMKNQLYFKMKPSDKQKYMQFLLDQFSYKRKNSDKAIKLNFCNVSDDILEENFIKNLIGQTYYKIFYL